MNEEYSSAHLKLQRETRWTRQASKKGKVAPLQHTTGTKPTEKANNEEPIDTKVNEKSGKEAATDDGFKTSKWISYFFHIDFPLFANAAAMKEYQMYNYLNVNPIIFIPAMLVYLVLIVMASGLIALGGDEGMDDDISTALIIGTTMMLVAVVFFIVYMIGHGLRKMSMNHTLIYYNQCIEYLPCRLEEFLLGSSVVAASLFLISRVLIGSCDEDHITLWQTQVCNPFASSGGIPTELAYCLYMLPVIAQLILKNLSACSLVISHVVCLSVVVFVVVYTKAWNDSFVILNSLLFMNASFEIERLQRVTYTQLKESQLQKVVALEHLKKEQAIQHLFTLQQFKLDRAEDEQRLRDVEGIQLRSLMGNVAHDLKTPLFAFEADVDTLKLFFNMLPEEAIQETTAKLRETRHINYDGLDDGEEDEDDIDPHSIFESLWATIRFMVAAINRGQDYMKSSNNVALVPSNTTFELSDTLSMASRCIRHLLPTGRHLVLHPLPYNLQPLISDQSWLVDNVLCLVGNAIKYSDSGDIDVHVEIVDTPCGNVIPMENEDEDHNLCPPNSPLLSRRASRPVQGPGQGQEGSHSIDPSQRASFLLTGVRRMSVLSTPIHHEGIHPPSGSFDSHVDHIASLVSSMGSSPPQVSNNHQNRSLSSVQTLLVTVEDHGIGIPENIRDTLFQPFRQAQRMAGGTGLGLFSLFKRVEALGGDCGVKDRLDGSQGSAIWFSFPYQPDLTWYEENAQIEHFTSLQHVQFYRRGNTQDWDEGLEQGEGQRPGPEHWEEHEEGQEERQDQQLPSNLIKKIKDREQMAKEKVKEKEKGMVCVQPIIMQHTQDKDYHQDKQ